jgi:hypothetical protein
MNKQKGIKKSFVQMDCDDKRLPPDNEIIRPYDERTLLSLKGEVLEDGTIIDGFQEQPIGIITKGRNYTFVWGRARLLFIRKCKREGTHTGCIDALIIEGIDPNDRAKWAIIENQARSPNRLNDWLMICEMRELNPMISEVDVYHQTGLPVATFRKLDATYGKIPKWANAAMLEGWITEAVAITVAKMAIDTQHKARDFYRKEGHLTANEAKELRQATHKEVYVGVANQVLQQEMAMPKEWFHRNDLMELASHFVAEEDREIIIAFLNTQ